MPILPDKLTTAQKRYDEIIKLAEREANQTDEVTQRIKNKFWEGGASGAQDICDIVGSDSHLLFKKQNLKTSANKAVKILENLSDYPQDMQDAINALVLAANQVVALSSELSAPHAITINPDGSAQITE